MKLNANIGTNRKMFLFPADFAECINPALILSQFYMLNSKDNICLVLRDKIFEVLYYTLSISN